MRTLARVMVIARSQPSSRWARPWARSLHVWCAWLWPVAIVVSLVMSMWLLNLHSSEGRQDHLPQPADFKFQRVSKPLPLVVDVPVREAPHGRPGTPTCRMKLVADDTRAVIYRNISGPVGLRGVSYCHELCASTTGCTLHPPHQC